MRTPHRHGLALALALALVVTACTGGSDSTPIVTGTTADGEIVVGDTAPPTTPPPPPTCPADTPVTRLDTARPSIEYFDEGPGLASVHISQATFECATRAVIVGDTDLNRVAIAAVLAAALGAPLLIGSANASGLIGFETERLAPEQIIAVGADAAFAAPAWTEIVTLAGNTAQLAGQVNALAGFESTITLPAETGVATLATTITALEAGAGLLPHTPTTTTTGSTTQTSTTTGSTAQTSTTLTTLVEPAATEGEIPDLSAGSGETGVAILVDGDQTAAALAAFASATASGAIASVIDDRDLRAVPAAGRALQSIRGGPGAIQVFGEVTIDSRWQLDVIQSAEELPGGGFLVLPRLFVALYGNPLTAALGALGEQGPADAATRIQGIAELFSAAEKPVVPVFEIIATGAHAGAGADGDYSTEYGNDVIQPWIDVAAQRDMYVILDLQPGASDFLSQAKKYETELLNPHVGLALDPEWRFEHSDQLTTGHDRRGSVSAAEVNQVVEWLANLVRENKLPQKVLLIHQFHLDMLPDRENIVTLPELQLIIQMDGQGAVPGKYVTWGNLTQGWEDHPWGWGWKNFYDEDVPGGGIAPADILVLVPTAVFVSYQ